MPLQLAVEVSKNISITDYFGPGDYRKARNHVLQGFIILYHNNCGN
jgi:hypothetical protein